ncbi:MAG: tRNA (adenosine(37)-N6)-threonylcarbamoyltransferase complex ATPase subunit type 1 TsaE [Candidatus Pelagibacter sp. TMED106]|jgi:tRNA threonylcarbamoyladenosine biosynthesis protein TsaE|nr:MAG: tRNA (adenosine(37)-N6)-threonylcarbamoyltransferase complex ATPase subunit type 1 TsaE [Candidatus Pelagibacter sp. TMED106]|tara:strand:+ start:446 stop:901 length:456 start_codon:yes stop_codon:yes gene_type:complete
MPIATNSGKIEISLEVKIAEIAKKFSKVFKKGDIVFLQGEIGVGKTTFVRYLINNYQKNKNLKLTEILSPTFNLVNEYDVGDFIIEHYDLFRLKDSNEINNIGLLENYKNVLTLIEWPEKIKKKVEKKIELKFEYGEDTEKRFLTISGLES